MDILFNGPIIQNNNDKNEKSLTKLKFTINQTPSYSPSFANKQINKTYPPSNQLIFPYFDKQ